jgi:hypothetical protein
VTTLLSLPEFLAKKIMIIISYSLCSVDLVLYGFFIFPKLKMVLRDGRFNDMTMNEVKLCGVFHEGFEQKHFFWACYIKCQGDSFEG